VRRTTLHLQLHSHRSNCTKHRNLELNHDLRALPLTPSSHRHPVPQVLPLSCGFGAGNPCPSFNVVKMANFFDNKARAANAGASSSKSKQSVPVAERAPPWVEKYRSVLGFRWGDLMRGVTWANDLAQTEGPERGQRSTTCSGGSPENGGRFQHAPPTPVRSTR
jgi:hypothetical protein